MPQPFFATQGDACPVSRPEPDTSVRYQIERARRKITIPRELRSEVGCLISSLYGSEGFGSILIDQRLPVFYRNLINFSRDHDVDPWDCLFAIFKSFDGLDKDHQYYFMFIFDILYEKRFISREDKNALTTRYYLEVFNDYSILGNVNH